MPNGPLRNIDSPIEHEILGSQPNVMVNILLRVLFCLPNSRTFFFFFFGENEFKDFKFG